MMMGIIFERFGEWTYYILLLIERILIWIIIGSLAGLLLITLLQISLLIERILIWIIIGSFAGLLLISLLQKVLDMDEN